jgi:S-formylglutathione hydrolase
MTIETSGEHRCFGGVQGYYRHESTETGTPMRFAVFLPPAAASGPVPVLYFLAGLTCTEENFTVKAGAQRRAAELGLALVMPDTSPRGLDLPGEHDNYDFGSGAGFYVDATAAPWAVNYRMYSYVTRELPALVEEHFAIDAARSGIFGHSMGGHGALVCALRNPDAYRSVSAFAPISAPMHCPWGEKAFTGYLGPHRAAWRAWDASALIEDGHRVPGILVDQGLADSFLASQLMPERLEQACAAAGQPLSLRRHPGYDHSYFFIATFVADHLEWHAARLRD